MPRPTPPALMDNADEVEALFYEALQQGDIVKLMSVFADEDEVSCVHPGGPRLIGSSAIRESFEAIFANGVIPVQPEQVRRLNALGLAVHHVVERVPVGGGGGGQRQDAWVLATNVYIKTPVGWRMVSHHASPGLPQAPAENRDPPATLH
jgi:uncharacterized protein (TIGR02246 family)